MDLLTIIMMCMILGGVWGGFAFALRVAVKNEEGKRRGGDAPNDGEDI